MQDQSVEIVSHVLAVLDEMIVPHVSAPAARAFADICSRLLHQVVTRELLLEGLEARRAEQSSLPRAQLEQLLDDPAAPRGVVQKSDLRDPLARAFAARLDGVDPTLTDSISKCVKMLLNSERMFLESLDPEVSFGIASMFSGGRVDREHVKFGPARPVAAGELSPSTLQRRLRLLGPQWAHVEVRALARLQGGFSKQTLRLELTGAPWSGAHFIIRRDRPNAYTGTTVADEFPVICAMFNAGLRVPEPLWLSPSGDLGPAFVIVRQVEGANDPSAWRHSPADAARFVTTLAQQMALLHTIPPAKSGLAGDPSTPVSDLVRADILRWSALARLDEASAPPLLVAERAWLLQNIPTSARKPVVVHSDIGFHNMLTNRGEVRALLDWEFCHLGDPQEDLNYVWPFVETIAPWDEFLRAYSEAGGHPFRAGDSLFWKVWGSFRSAAGCASALHAFKERSFGSAAEAVTLAVSGLNFGPRYELEVADLIAESIGIRRGKS